MPRWPRRPFKKVGARPPRPTKDPGVLLKDPGVLLKDSGVLLKDPGVLLTVREGAGPHARQHRGGSTVRLGVRVAGKGVGGC